MHLSTRKPQAALSNHGLSSIVNDRGAILITPPGARIRFGGCLGEGGRPARVIGGDRRLTCGYMLQVIIRAVRLRWSPAASRVIAEVPASGNPEDGLWAITIQMQGIRERAQ
jgi:hypothetical protein